MAKKLPTSRMSAAASKARKIIQDVADKRELTTWLQALKELDPEACNEVKEYCSEWLFNPRSLAKEECPQEQHLRLSVSEVLHDCGVKNWDLSKTTFGDYLRRVREQHGKK